MSNKAPTPRTSRFRKDIEGLRGLAIALVVVFHVFVGRVSSGVDVFLLLGGVFFFGGQLANAQNPRGLTFSQSLIRILRRLFPLLVVVVATTLLATFLLLTRLVHRTNAIDATAALGYYINWHLAESGREYAAVQSTVSPFQHLWSMSAQLQIYAGSLAAVFLIAFIFRRFAQRALVVILVLATVASLGYATWLQGEDQALNYYSTFSRFWEIGLGGLVGLVIMPRKQLPRWARLPEVPAAARIILGLLGVSMIVATGFVLNGSNTFPGPWTLFPLSGAIMVLLAGHNGQPVGVTRLLESPPMQFLGRISYALYLWHWPLMVVLVAWKSVDPHRWIVGGSIILASVALAWLTHTFVELPLRQKDRPQRAWALWTPAYWWRSLRVWPKTAYALVIMALAGAVVVSPAVVRHHQNVSGEQLWELARNQKFYPGAAALSRDAHVPPGMALVPPLEDLDKLLPPTQADGCYRGFDGTDLVFTQQMNASQQECAYGDVGSQRTVYIVGGSHSEHYLPALDEVGRRQGVKFIPVLKMGCPLNARVTKVDGSEYPECAQWSQLAEQWIMEHPPTDGVFLTGTRPTSIVGAGPEVVPPEYVDVVRRFSDAGIHTFLMRDNPWHMQPEGSAVQGWKDVRLCVQEMMEGTFTATEEGRGFPGVADESAPTPEEVAAINRVCGSPQAASLLPEDPQLRSYAGLDATVVDITHSICRDSWCPAIIGNVVAYRDSHHFTNVFSRTLADDMERQMFVDRRELRG